MNPKERQIGLTVCSDHATCTFQSESRLYSCLNVNELLARIAVTSGFN